MSNLFSVLKQLEQERSRLSWELARLTSAVTALNGASRNTTRKGMSAAGRARIAAAQRARWAKVKGRVVPITARKERKLSAAAIAHIRAAQKARWARWRKKQKGA
jgi:hypothetical protein